MLNQLPYPKVKKWLSEHSSFHSSVALNAILQIDLYEQILEAIKTRKSKVPAPQISIKEWLKFYESDELRLQSMNNATAKYLPKDVRRYSDENTIDKIMNAHKKLLDRNNQLPEGQLVSKENSPELAIEIIKLCTQMSCSTIALHKELNIQQISFLNGNISRHNEPITPEKYFIATVFFPALVFYGYPPGKLLKKAQAGDFEALQQLLLIDSSIIFDATISKMIHEDRLHNPDRAIKLLELTTKAPRIQEFRKKAKYIVAGKILAMTDIQSKILGIPELTGPDILRLFDAYANDRYGYAQDHDFAKVQPGSFTKTAREAARQWLTVFSPGNLF